MRGAIAAFVLAAFAFVAGVESERERLWPAQGWAKIRSQIRMPLPAPWAQRVAVACPRDAVVILVIGQSHAANYVDGRFTGAPGVINAYRGQCYLARDPLLGAEGTMGNVWTDVGNRIVGSGMAKSVVILNPAIGSSRIEQWAPGGSLNDYLRKSIAGLPDDLAISHVAIQIGEADYLAQTSERDFRTGLTSLVAFLRKQNISAPIFVARESLFCSQARPDNPVALVQRTFRASGVKPGPNMDALPYDRYDGCHLTMKGARELAAQWVEVFAADRAGSESASSREL